MRKGDRPRRDSIVRITADSRQIPIPTHKLDHFKSRVGIEVEWNNKTDFYDRDLNDFRLPNFPDGLSVGVIITRVAELQVLFNALSIGPKYGPSTTRWNRLIRKTDGGCAAPSPILMIGLGTECFGAAH